MRYFLFLSVLFILLSSCKSKKILQPTPERSKSEIIQSLLERNIDFMWFNAKMSVYIDSPDEKISGSIHAKMIKDSSILISLKKFGIEAARVFADQKNYTVLYRFEAAYESGSIDQFKKFLTFSTNFEDLQQLFAGNIILPDTSSTTLSKEGNSYIVSSHVDDLFIQYYVDSRKLELSKMLITDNSNRTATIQYEDYRDIPSIGIVAFSRNFTVPINSNENANMELKFSNIEINKPFEIKFSIPSNYERMY